MHDREPLSCCWEVADVQSACQSGSMYYNVMADSHAFPMLTLQSAASQVSPPIPAVLGMAQDFEHFGLLSGGLVPQLVDSSRGLWCLGIHSDVAKEWSFLLDKNGMTPGSKAAAETCVEGGVMVVRSQLCPWSSLNVHNTNRIAATDPIRFQRILEDALLSPDARRVGRNEGWCKYCAILEKELTSSLEVKQKWGDENWEDVSFKQVDQYFDSRTISPLDQDSRKRKYGLDDWENDRAVVLLKLNELNMRATRAEQRVLELEQLLRDHALVALDDPGDDSDIVTSASHPDCFTEEQAEMLVCKIAGCNKSFKSSKTLRRHVLQKHSDNARFLVCNQPTVNGVMCRFETIHSGVLSYHRKHSLAHQRREDWHISCPFCHSKFARQHEMERHQRICKSRPAGRALVSSTGVTTPLSSEPHGLPLPLHLAGGFAVPDRYGHAHHGLTSHGNTHSFSVQPVPGSHNMESSITF